MTDDLDPCGLNENEDYQVQEEQEQHRRTTFRLYPSFIFRYSTTIDGVAVAVSEDKGNKWVHKVCSNICVATINQAK